ncbi:hypothetical protein [Phyllobacterium pellucidum]|uniref:hypothetical protein n=1 Tax=Phyllobacterium pellucidum TaxID=2740464 RepID=UPI001D135CE7|nr:hypothetical protein [Phyllobacterium sp. T1018]UGY10661.1 hypothetical protein LLE51_005675 [Phyllobacterium sp. T1018]
MAETERTNAPYLKALTCSAIVFVLAIGAYFLGYTLPSFTSASDAASRLFGLALVPGLIVGLFAKKSPKPWPLWLIIGGFVVVLIAVTVIHEMTASMRA